MRELISLSDRILKNDLNHDQNYWLGETASLLALSLMDGIGYWTIRKLVLSGISLKKILKANSIDEFKAYFTQAGCKVGEKVVNTWLESLPQLWKEANRIHHQLELQKIEVIHFKQSKFPLALRKIKEPPMWLFVQGDVSALHEPGIAIVGTRKPSEDGKFLAEYIGRCLPNFNGVTVSGLANGIDQTVHKHSLRFGVRTIAFIGTGILKNYPAGSEKLRQEIYQNKGAIVSEYLPNQTYSAENFVRRNRLQAGLARVVIPVEWKVKSGTAHTVRFAKEANRKIICLKLPDWEDSRPELLKAAEINAEILNIPGQESDLIRIVQSSLNADLDIDRDETRQSSSDSNGMTFYSPKDNIQLELPL